MENDSQNNKINERCFAQSIVNSINQDGIRDKVLLMGEEDFLKIVEAYAAHAVKKMDKFTSIYMTNPEARECFRKRVAAYLTETQPSWNSPKLPRGLI